MAVIGWLQVINAALALAAKPNSKVAQDNMDLFKEQWEKQVRVLTDAVDDITSIDDFLCVSGKWYSSAWTNKNVLLGWFGLVMCKQAGALFIGRQHFWSELRWICTKLLRPSLRGGKTGVKDLCYLSFLMRAIHTKADWFPQRKALKHQQNYVWNWHPVPCVKAHKWFVRHTLKEFSLSIKQTDFSHLQPRTDCNLHSGHLHFTGSH